MKRIVVVLAIVSASGLLTGCREEAKIRQKVSGYIDRTEPIPREFVYAEEASGKQIVITGRIEDSLRFQESLRIDGADVLEQIVDDDAVGLRIVDSSKFPAFVTQSPVPGLNPLVAQTLLGGGWVIDPSGAPTLRKDTRELELRTGFDPLQEAVETLRYVRAAIIAAADVKEWSETDLLPAYRDFEDHFPPSDPEKGIRRFDLVRPVLPRPQQPGGGGFQGLPRTAHFRKMAIYVEGRSVVRVMEEIDIDGHFEFVEARREGKKRLLDLLETVKRGEGQQERIRPRKLSVEFKLGGEVLVRRPEGLLAKIPQADAIGRLFGDAFAASPPPQPGPTPSPPSA